MRYPSFFVLAFGLCFAACGSSTSTEGSTLAPPRYVDGTPGGADTSGGGNTTSTPTTACGATTRETDGRPCAVNEACQISGWTCTCTQGLAPQCGGVEHPPELLPAVWSCAPDDPTANRDDGCPFTAPVGGVACTHGPQTCSYRMDSCGFHTRNAQCAGGVWAVQDLMRPPPP